VRCRLILHGRVQGVGFRAFIARRAQSRHLAGWVRNRADGTVEVVLEGASDDVDSLARACREGPRAASVTEVETFAEAPEGLRRFEIR
jgi:acylphosphatase